MKFGKQLENEAEDIPSEWRPYLIQYKALKKLIAKVATEIEKRGLSAAFLRQALQNEEVDLDPDAPRIQYYFTGEPPNVRPCIRFTYNRNHKRISGLLSKLVDEDDQVNDDESELSPAKLHYNRTEDQVDFFTLSRRNSAVDDETQVPEAAALTKENMKRRQSATAALLKQLAELSLQDEEQDRIRELDDDAEQGMNITVKDRESKETTDAPAPPAAELKSVVIELEQDDEFFQMLMTELSQATALQDKTKQRFEQDVNELEHRMVKVASPSHVNDMYAWREIFGVYMDAQIFRGRIESDRTIRSVQKSKAQLQWFTQQLEKQNLLSRFKTKSSKQAFEQFIALNTELITMKHYQLLNQTAVTKILKKHDKRSGLTATSTFPSIIQNDYIFSPKLADILCAAVLAKITAVIPQPDDYLCPVCMSIAWRPIRLVCGHVFCVRCLIKAQKKHMDDCPLCRHPKAVQHACALNLDVPLQNFMKMYFPKEIKQKKKDNEREQVLEDVQAIMGRAYTEEQLLRMNRRQQDNQCIVM